MFLRKNRNPAPATEPIAEPLDAKPNSPTEYTPTLHNTAYSLLDEARQQMNNFATEAEQRGLTPDEISEAATDAINSGALPRYFRGIAFRRSPAPVTFLHGVVPPGVIHSYTYEGKTSLSINPESLPTQPDTETESGFFAETHYVTKPIAGPTPELAATVELMQQLSATPAEQ